MWCTFIDFKVKERIKNTASYIIHSYLIFVDFADVTIDVTNRRNRK